jgi:hypothetical protein
MIMPLLDCSLYLALNQSQTSYKRPDGGAWPMVRPLPRPKRNTLPNSAKATIKASNKTAKTRAFDLER